MSLLAELKRRNVFRVAVLYLAASWLVLQITDVLSSLLELPPGVGRFMVVLVALGFPVALAVAWIYELTPEGLKRETEASHDPALQKVTARRLNVLTLVVALLAIAAVIASWWLQGREVAGPESAESPATDRPPVAQAAAKAIAVLPFANLSSDPEQEFFADGVTEEILNLLAGVEGLRVTSRTSAFAFKDQQVDLPTIARQLGVGYVVEGSVRKAADRVRVTAQLIEVDSDQHLWSETYERRLDDVFEIQSEIAGQVARVLKIALGAEERTSIGRAPTRDLDAWQMFLRARFLVRNRTKVGDVEEALSLVDAAIELDPQFARAHSLRALLLMLRPIWRSGDVSFELQRAAAATPEEIAAIEADWAESMREASLALQLDPKLGEPHAVRALHAQAYNRYAEAKRSFRWAIGRAPSDPDIRNWYGSFLLEAGYVEEGVAEKLRAAELDPLSPLIAWQLAYAGLVAGRADLMMDYSAKARENGWGGWQAWATQGAVAVQRGDMQGAVQLFVRALPQREREVRMSMEAIRRRAIDDETRAMLAGLEPYGPPGLGRLAVQVLAGDLDGAFATIYGTIDPDSLLQPDGSGGPPRPRQGERPGSVLRGDWWFRANTGLRRDPRFAQLMRSLGLVEFWRDSGWPDHCRPDRESVRCE